MQPDLRRARRALAIAVAVLAGALAVPSASAVVVLPGDPYTVGTNDCGSGHDTPPALLLESGQGCLGSTYREAWRSRSDARCPFNLSPYDVKCFIDEYEIPASDGDLVLIDMADHQGEPLDCGTFWWTPDGERGSGSGSTSDGYASGTQGRWGYIVRAAPGTTRQRLYVVTPTLDPAEDHLPRRGTDGDCGTGEDYAITVHRAHNQRPQVVGSTVPATIRPGDTVPITIQGVDHGGGALSAVGMRAAPGQPWHPQEQFVGVDGQGVGTVHVDIRHPVDLDLVARDEYSAESAPVRVHLDVTQDDCGTGSDVSVTAMALDSTCSGHLSSEMGDDLDSYQVTVPDGSDGLALDLALLHPDLRAQLVAVSPAGVRTVSPDGRVSVPGADVGQWTVEVERLPGPDFVDRSSGGYALTVVELSSAGPPAVELVSVPSAVRAWHPAPVTVRAVDPGGRALHYEIDWGDGHQQRVPSAGTVASGQPVTVEHAFEWRAAPAVATVTAVAIDGQRASAQFEVTTQATVDSCLGWPAAHDATGSADPVALDPQRPVVDMPAACSGEIGYGLQRINEFFVRTDDEDAFELHLDGTDDLTQNGQPVAFVATSLGPAAFDIEVRSLTVAAGRAVLGDVRISRHVAAGAAEFFTWEAVAPNERFVVLVRHSAGSPPGAYRWTARQAGLLDDF